MSSPRHSQKIEISIYVNDAGSPSKTDPRPDKPPVVIKVKDTAKRKLEFAQGISKTSPNQRIEISNVRQTSAGPIRIAEFLKSAGPTGKTETPTSAGPGSRFTSSEEPSTSTTPLPVPKRNIKKMVPRPALSAQQCLKETPTSSSAGPGSCFTSSEEPSTSTTPLPVPRRFWNVKRMASRPEVLSAQQYLKVVKEVLLDRSSCPQQHSPVIRKRLPGGKRPLSSDEESDNEDDNSEVKSSSSCEGTSKIKKEPEVFPQQEMDKEADSGSDVEIIGEEWPNKCQVKKEKVHVSSQTQTDDCEPFKDGVRQSPSFPGIFSGIQFCIFGDKKEILKNKILSCGGTVRNTPLELDDEITSLFISSYSVCESRLELSTNALWEYRRLYRDYNIVTISRDWILDSMDRRALQPLINYLVNDNRGCEIPEI